MIKTITFLGNSLEEIRNFPPTVRQAVGYQLDRVQHGLNPMDFKPIHNVGSGVYEIRVRDVNGAFRAMYIAKFEESIYVLHAFQKKTQKTAKSDIELVAHRYRNLLQELST